MRDTITISLPHKLKQELDKLMKEDGVSRSDIVRESLREYLFQRRFNRLRDSMMAELPTPLNDEDVFGQVS